MKKVIMFFLLTAFFLSLNASSEDISTDLYHTGVYYQGEQEVQTQAVQLPADFNYEIANQELIQAEESGNIERANLLSLQINTYWLENRVESFDPTTQGSGSSTDGSNGSIMYRNNEENSNNSPSIPYWFDDVRIDPRNGIHETSLVSLSNGELYCISRYGNSFILIRRSIDGGVNWTTYWDHQFGSNYLITCPRIIECHDTLIISFVIKNTTTSKYRTWAIAAIPGNTYHAVSQGSPLGYIDARITDYRICASIYSYAYICATWIESYGPTNSFDSTRVMYAKANGCNLLSWVIGPNRIERTGGGGSNNIYFDDSRIAHGSGGRLWIVACLHPNLYPTNDKSIKGWYSTDFGSSWSSTTQITPINNGIDEYQPSIAGSHTNDNWVCLTTTEDIAGTYKRIRNYYSTDNGTNWTNSAWVTSYENYLPDVWVDDNSTAFFGACRRDVSSGEVVWYRQGDIGNPTSWSNSIRINDDNSNLSNAYGPSVAYNYASGDAIIAWTNYNSNIYSIWFDDESWSLGVEETPVDVSGGMVVLAPNPSKDFATLSYSVVNEGPVNISIYDASGRMVENLVNAVKQTGQHSLTIDNENLSSGFYLIRIVTPDGVNTENMRVVK